MPYNNNTGLPLAQCWQDFHDVLDAGINKVVLYGPPGTGKTYAGLTYGLGDRPAFRLPCTEDMTDSEVRGAWMPSETGAFVWHNGQGTRAWATGGRLVVDEVDRASGDVLSLLLAYTDSEASASVDLPTGETIRPYDGFSAILTSNIESPDDLPTALRDRFPVALNINVPHPEALMTLPEHLRTVATAVVSAEPHRRASLRAFYAYDTLIKGGLSQERSAELTFGKVRAEAIIEALRFGRLGA